MLHFIHFYINFWFLFYFLLLFFPCCQIFNNILVFAQDGVCSSEELNFGRLYFFSSLKFFSIY